MLLRPLLLGVLLAAANSTTTQGLLAATANISVIVTTTTRPHAVDATIAELRVQSFSAVFLAVEMYGDSASFVRKHHRLRHAHCLSSKRGDFQGCASSVMGLGKPELQVP